MEHLHIPDDRPWAESASADDIARDLLLADFYHAAIDAVHLPVLDKLPSHEERGKFPGVMGRALTEEELRDIMGE